MSKETTQKKESTHIDTFGGQAVVEGVLMMSQKNVSIAVRTPNKGITIKTEPRYKYPKFIRFLKWPFIRGITNLVEMMVVGMRALMYSTNESTEEKSEEFSTWQFLLMLFIGLGLALLLFKFIPLWLTQYVYDKKIIGESNILFNILDGFIRLLFFVLYLVIISRMKEVQILFQYHGAEHKTVHCYEHKKPLSVENVKKESPQHPRCGTGLLLVVFLLFIIVFSFVPITLPFWQKFLYRLLLVPLIAGVSYELVRFISRFQGFFLFRWLSLPGLWLQRLTTKEPSDDQIEVAIAALKSVQEADKK